MSNHHQTTSAQRQGAQLGNQNARKDGEPFTAFCSIRCKKGEKSRWVRAANLAKARGLLDKAMGDGRQRVFPAWVTYHLNRAAEAELALDHHRKRGPSLPH